MSDIFREVEEDLRRERAEDLWKSYGAYAIGAVVGIIAIVAGVSWWNSASQSAAEGAAREFVAASQLVEEGDTQAAADAFAAIAESASGGYEAAASLRAASLQAQAGDVEGAIATFDAIAAGGGDETLKGLASIRAALLMADTASPDDLKIRLTPLAAVDSPWRFSALELLGYAALRDSDTNSAAEYYQQLADATGGPPLARERARDMLRGLQVEGPVARQLPASGATETAPLGVEQNETEDAQ
ncbi:MAG: tetratricopeptide repeat protein [Candidatus Phaeomarinobacter sp.]